MKAKIIRGNGARGASDYALNEGRKAKKGKIADLIGGNMSGTNARELSQEFAISRRLRPEAKKPVYHFSLSCPAGERLSVNKWSRVAERFLQKMNIDTGNHQYFVSHHTDTEYDHVHIIASRIGLDGSLFHGKNDVFCAIKTTSEIEKEFNLMPTPTLDFEKKSGKKKPTSAEIQQAARTGNAPPRLVIQNVIDEIFNNLDNDCSLQDFFLFLEASQIFVRPNIAKTGRMNGLAFEHDGIYFKGSSLGKDYSWKSLVERGLQYEQARDSKYLGEKKDEFDRRKSEKNKSTIERSGRENRRSGTERICSKTDDSSNKTALVGIEKNNVCTDKKSDPIKPKDAMAADNSHQHTDKHIDGNGHLAAHFKTMRASVSDQVNIDPDAGHEDDLDDSMEEGGVRM